MAMVPLGVLTAGNHSQDRLPQLPMQGNQVCHRDRNSPKV